MLISSHPVSPHEPLGAAASGHVDNDFPAAGAKLSNEGALFRYGNTLAVADRSRTSTNVWIHLVDLNANTNHRAFFPRASGEGGTFTVAWGADGAILISGTYEGSGWVPLRRYDPVTHEHFHVRCIECGRLDDIYANPEIDLPRDPDKTGGYEIKGILAEFQGLCPSCKSKGDKNRQHKGG